MHLMQKYILAHYIFEYVCCKSISIVVDMNIKYIPYQRVPNYWVNAFTDMQFYKYEDVMMRVCRHVLHIDLNVDGHIMYMARGVFLKYTESKIYESNNRTMWAIMAVILSVKVITDDEPPRPRLPYIMHVMGYKYDVIHRYDLFISIELELFELCNYDLYSVLHDNLPSTYSLRDILIVEHDKKNVQMVHDILLGIINTVVSPTTAI